MIYIALSKHHIRYYIVIYDKYHIKYDFMCLDDYHINGGFPPCRSEKMLSRISRLQQGCFEKMPEMEAA
jgi:hypothetical protein